MKTISVVNHKGGVGKTTSTLNFGGELAKKGYKVLLIDFDSQGNLSQTAAGRYLEPQDKARPNIAEALDRLLEDRDPIFPIYTTGINGMDIIPCDLRFANIIIKLNYAVAREGYLRQFISLIKEKFDYDYVLIDNAPTIEISFQNSLAACDEVLIVSEPDIYSMEGINTLISQINKIRRYFNPDLEIAGILINKMDKRTNYSKDMAEIIGNVWKEKIKVYETMIPKSVKTQESQAAGMLVSDHSPENPVGVAFKKFTDEYLRNRGIY